MTDGGTESAFSLLLSVPPSLYPFVHFNEVRTKP